MSSRTSPPRDMSDNVLYIQFSIYVIVGTALLISNLLLAVAIGRSPSLRKKYACLLAEFFTDGLSGLAAICAGAGRMTVMFTVPSTTLRSRRYCMLMPWNLLFIWTDPMSSIVLLIISLDRLFTLLFPVSYFKYSLRFQVVQISLWHSFMTLSIATSWTLALQEDEPLYDPICWSSASMVSWYNDYSFLLRMSTVVASIVLYVLVYAMSRRHARRLTKLGGGDRNTFDARQRHLTVTMGISCVFTIILYLLPITLEYALDGVLSTEMTPFLTTYSLISSNLNPIVNVYIIVRRHADVARALGTIVSLPMLRSRNTSVQGAVSVVTAFNPQPATRGTQTQTTAKSTRTFLGSLHS